jgi:hypothetical protein
MHFGIEKTRQNFRQATPFLVTVRHKQGTFQGWQPTSFVRVVLSVLTN